MVCGHFFQAGTGAESAVELVLNESAVIEDRIGIVEYCSPESLQVQVVQVEAVHGDGVQHHVDIQHAGTAHTGEVVVIEWLSETEGQGKSSGRVGRDREESLQAIELVETLSLVGDHDVEVEIFLPMFEGGAQDTFGCRERTVMVGSHAGEVEDQV